MGLLRLLDQGLASQLRALVLGNAAAEDPKKLRNKLKRFL
jgi:hypothetical protein